MKSRFVQEGNTLDYTNSTSSAISAGDVVVLGNKVGIAATDIPIGAKGAVKMNGVFEVLKDEAAVFTQGATVYYDTINDEMVAESGDNTVVAGYAAYAASVNSTTVYVKLAG